ncbi:MAG TPA: hypothetical protein VL096_14385, partial [Pirellulaceae bacterium]|nr:hypothetical protein [Pirellulaceae bacterium]
QKSFEIERNGYGGPLEVRLADRQGRHLQGVVGPVVIVPPEASSFDYTATLPPWMELGRTSRTNLMLTGEVADNTGKKHKVCFSTNEQNDQLIALVAPAPLRIALAKSVLTLPQERTFVVPVQLHRDRSLTAPIRLELIAPAHLKSITAESIIVPPGATTAELHFQRQDVNERLNAPFIIRGTTEHDGRPLVAETTLEWIRSP